MRDSRRRLFGRLFYCVLVAGVAMGLEVAAFAGPADSQSGTAAATTTVADTVYLADGSDDYGAWNWE